MASVVGAATRGAGRPKNAPAKPSIEIKLEQHYTARVYTSGSTISGHAIIKTQKDTPFAKLEIVFIGIVATRLEFVQSYSTNSTRTILKLRMPDLESALPQSHIFEAGKEYTVPFNFVVPHQLTLNACNHGHVADAVQEQHLRLPPSIGCWSGDDQAPEMTNIEYAVKARVISGAEAGQATVMEAKKIVKVLPALPEDAPLDITSKDERYCMSKTKTFRKNLIAGKLGELTASASQPSAIILSADAFGASETSARVRLSFAPASADATAPKVNSVTSKLLATTYFGSAPLDSLPNLGSRTSFAANPCLTYAHTTNLNNMQIDSVSWVKKPAPVDRRDSGYATASADEEAAETDESNAQAQGNNFSKKNSKKSKAPSALQVATLDIPVKIPVSNKKMFLPTFHNCLISRTYVLQLVINVGPTNTTMTLNLPLQLAVETIFDAPGEELPSFETAVALAEAAEADSYLVPRQIQIPNPALQGNSVLPGYEEHTRRSIPVL
jgi:hypothetical protein